MFFDISFSNKYISLASVKDAVEIMHLLNSAYRGESSKKGWTTEAHLIAGEVRTNLSAVEEAILKSESVILKYMNDENKIIGCVNLQQYGKKVYLGMLSVSPHLQGGGIGKALLQAAEEFGKQINCSSIYMTVISVRDELINWYKKHGYIDTAERKQFIEDAVSGKHLQELEFMVLEKQLNA
jgi:ribosomal protein S18 acetylase RimI-like enzyme